MRVNRGRPQSWNDLLSAGALEVYYLRRVVCIVEDHHGASFRFFARWFERNSNLAIVAGLKRSDAKIRQGEIAISAELLPLHLHGQTGHRHAANGVADRDVHGREIAGLQRSKVQRGGADPQLDRNWRGWDAY